MSAMRASGLMISLSVCVLLLGGCGSSSKAEETIAARKIAVLNDLAARLALIKNAADLSNAKPDLEKLGNRFQEIQMLASQQAKPAAADQAAIGAKYKADTDTAHGRVKEQLDRLVKDVRPTAPLEVINDMQLQPTALSQ